MRFNVGDRVRVSRSAIPDYVGIEGVVIAAHDSGDAIFNEYRIKTADGLEMMFLEYQLEPA
jgi:hypothetical protein